MLLWLSAERAAGQSFMQAHFKNGSSRPLVPVAIRILRPTRTPVATSTHARPGGTWQPGSRKDTMAHITSFIAVAAWGKDRAVAGAPLS